MRMLTVGLMLLALAGCRTTPPPEKPPLPKPDTGPKQPPPGTPQTEPPAPVEQREPRVGRPPSTPTPTHQHYWN